MLLVHQTKLEHIFDILEQNEISSFAVNKKVGHSEGSYPEFSKNGKNLVYLTVLFKDFLFYFPKNDEKVFLFFDNQLLKNQKPLFFCSKWFFGNKDKNHCIKYDKNLSVYQNYKIWQKLYEKDNPFEKQIQRYIYGIDITSPLANEIVMDKSVSLDNLVGIYCHNAKFKHPLLMTKSSEIELFLNQHGYYEVDTASKINSYTIPFDIDMTDSEHDKNELNFINKLKKKKFKTKKWQEWSFY